MTPLLVRRACSGRDVIAGQAAEIDQIHEEELALKRPDVRTK
jgi:hypothetical protein